jgi:hypothetical protein
MPNQQSVISQQHQNLKKQARDPLVAAVQKIVLQKLQDQANAQAKADRPKEINYAALAKSRGW